MKKLFFAILFVFFSSCSLNSQKLEQLWQSPPEESRSWAIWYWMQGAISKEGITADLEAMKEVGIAGAYLMTIKGIPEKPFIEPVIEQLTPLWWEMITYAFREAHRLGIKIGFHLCDGFALAGGPWITPELSMQKVVWSRSTLQGGKSVDLVLPQPEDFKGYYRDIAVFAYPSLPGEGEINPVPRVTTSVSGVNAQFLADVNSRDTFRSDEPCWIQFMYNQPFTCRSVQIRPAARNLQSQRLAVETSADGVNFTRITQLEPSRHGWQNDDYPITYSLPPTTARHFRFLYDPRGTEPGSEDLDAAKWRQTLRILSINLSSEARIHQYEGKNGSIWRISPRTVSEQISDTLCIDKKHLVDIFAYMDKSGRLRWDAPSGKWTVLRMGHTSTGQTNATGGKGAGLECDKFNPEAVRLQFNSWFGEAFNISQREQLHGTLALLHLDSWECGSQNWSPLFRDEFQKRRGYDLCEYLPVMAGIPVESVAKSEKILHDVRQTIAELVTDVFFRTLQEETHTKGCLFSAQSVAPTMISDGMAHHRYTDYPMGEYWLKSPTHDKPNDVLDAVSGAHIYGKNVVMAEAFTQLRCDFTEYPGMLKIIQDRNYAMGINRIAHHVFVLNPWLDKKPGMTLDGIGLYFQRDQTWWKLSKAWMDYAQRCQALLQFGQPVVDLAAFTGEELPRRSILPDRLIPFIPGIFGNEKVEQEKIRLANAELPTKQMPAGVTHSSNIYIAEDWINPLRGYAYDSFNPDALSQAEVIDGKIVLPSGMKYSALLIPAKHPKQPDSDQITESTQIHLQRLAEKGACIIETPHTEQTFGKLERDLIVTEDQNEYAPNIAWAHRQNGNTDIYFISNQTDQARELKISLRVSEKIPEIWNPVNGDIHLAKNWQIADGRTSLPLRLDASESIFIVLRKSTLKKSSDEGRNWAVYQKIMAIDSPWVLQFDPLSRGPEQPVIFESLTEWNEHSNELIHYYSGTTVYSNIFTWNGNKRNDYYIEFENIYHLANVKINGIDCGTLWTKPYRLNISKALKQGQNEIRIEVANTWANRIMGDEVFNAEKDEGIKIWTNARYRVAEKRLTPSGLTGEVRIVR